MIRNLCIILICFLSFNNLKAQNLVPNYSFEEYRFCPSLPAQLDTSCKFWFTPLSASNINSPPFSINNNGSSDYFNRCSTSNYSVPTNIFGYQNVLNGDAYSGIAITISKYSGSLNNHTYKEYLENTLISELEIDKEYCIEFDYSIVEIEFWDLINVRKLVYYPISIGVLITDTIVKRHLQQGVKQPLNICATPNYEAPLVSYKDTVNWNKISGHFTAKGGEQYLTIGNFECNPTDYNPDSVGVYIYIDNVRLYRCNPDSNSIVDSMIVPNIFTPNGDSYNDKFEYKYQKQWEFETQIFNRWGNLVFDNNVSRNWDGTYQGERVSSGVYFYIIKAQAIKTGEIRIYKGTVTVMY